MRFLYPEFLWGFLLLSIPIIIHLFNFKRYKKLYFSSLKFVKHVDQQTRSTQRLKHYLILFSRILAFTFLILAFAQPYFGDQDIDSDKKGRVTMIYIDNSFSMQAKGSDGELLSQAQESVRELIQKSAIDARFVIGTNEMSGMEERILNKSQALKKVDEITYYPVSRDAIEILKWQTGLTRRKDNAVNASTYMYYSDFQVVSEIQKKADKIKFPNVPVVPIKLNPETSNNIYIDSVWFSSPVHKANSNTEINIRVVNSTKNDIENLELNALIGTTKRTIFLNVLANNNSIAKFTYRDEANGWIQGVLTIADDEINFDDNYYLSYQTSGAKILIINGEDYIDNINSVYALDNYYTVNSTQSGSVTRNDIADKDLIILNGLNSVSPGLIELLQAHEANSGVLAFIPGKDPNIANWNDLLSKFSLPQFGGKITSGTGLKELAYKDDFFTSVFEKETKSIRLPGVGTAFKATGGEGYPLIKMENGLPLFVRQKKKGQAFAFYAPIHTEVNEFTSDALFTTLFLRIGELSKRLQPISLEIGSSTRFPIFNLKNSEEALHIKGDKLDLIPEHEVINGVYYMSLNQYATSENLLAGNYSIVSKNGQEGLLSLNFNRSESRLNYLNDSKLAELFTGAKNLKINKIGSDSTYDPSKIYKPISYWKICIILTLIFVLTEMALVRFLK